MDGLQVRPMGRVLQPANQIKQNRKPRAFSGAGFFVGCVQWMKRV